jgi:hypothetical protein
MAPEVATTCTEDFSALSSGFPNVLSRAYEYVLSTDIETREDSRKCLPFFFRSSQPLFVKMEDIYLIRYAWRAYAEAYVESEKDWQVTSEFEGIADDACIEFCNSHRLIPDLRMCLDQVQEIFSNRRSVRANFGYFEDEGNEDSGHVVIRLEVQTSQDAVLEEYDRWIDWFIDNLSATNRTLFTLTVSRI